MQIRFGLGLGMALALLACGEDAEQTAGAGGGATVAGSGGAVSAGGSSADGGAGTGGEGGAAVVDTVETYPGLPNDLYASTRYEVEVEQAGNAHPSYVYVSENDLNPTVGARALMTDTNHWTSFSSVGTVMVRVTLPERATIASARVHPLRLGIDPVVTGNQISFELDTHENLWVEVDGEEADPLFVFSNPPETDVPAEGDPNVIYFGPGLHDPPESLLHELPSGTTVYIAGGAYVRSLVSAEHNASNITIRGRGILSGIHLPWVPEWGSHMLEMPGGLGTNNRIEGVTFTDGPKSNFVINGEVDISNIRLLGWHRNNDGMTVGANSTVDHVFAKVNDDVFKLYFSNINVNDVVVWEQPPGSTFQLSWNLSRNVTGVRVSDVDIIHTDRTSGDFNNRKINDSIISCRNFNGGSGSDYVFDGVRIEGQTYQVVGLHLEDELQGFTSGDGSLSGIVFRDFQVESAPAVPSYLNGNGTASSTISNVTFDGLYIAGEHITDVTNGNGDLVLSVENQVTGTSFQ